jgi:hypothetical protein
MPRAGKETGVSRTGRLVCVLIAGAGVALAVRAGVAERHAPREIRATEILGATVWWIIAAAVLVAAVATFDVAIARRSRG